MRFSATTFLNFATVTGAAAMMFVGAYHADKLTAGADGIDPVTTASVSAHSKSQPLALADQFTVINHRDGRSCVLKLHRAEGYDVHRVEPSANCALVSADLPEARAWQENASGIVNIADRQGNSLMRLGRSDGFAWEVVQPVNIDISLQAF